MDSGNSGSMQSSSGGDEEYDSRSETVSAFLNPSTHFLPNPQPSFLSHHQNPHLPTIFDPSSSYFQAFSQSHQPNSNPDSLLTLDHMVQSKSIRSEPSHGSGTQIQRSSSVQLRSVQDNGVKAKKRSRASRRAPTTVLTTDTSNFRAMVQEFTGIPAPPFQGFSYSRRLDLFGSRLGIRPGPLEPLGPLYPLRPSAHKVQQSPYPLASSMVDATSTNSLNSIQDLGLPKTQNVLTFNPLVLQPPLPPHSLNSGFEDAKSPGSLPVPSLGELGMSHGHVTAYHSGLPSHGNPNQWRSFNEYYGNSQRGSGSCKLNFSGSSEFLHHEKQGLENISARGEGTVESWICPSD